MTEIAFDTETKGLAWFDPNEQAFLGTWADERNEYCAKFTTKKGRAEFAKVLKRAHTLIAHNFKFDCHQTRETTGFDGMGNGHIVEDTDLISRVLHPEGQHKGARGGHGLKELATVYLRADAQEAEDKIKEMGKTIGLKTLKRTGAYYEVWRAYPDVMEHYAKMDARYTFDLFKRFQKELRNDDAARRIYYMEQRVLPILVSAEQRGTQVDPEAVEGLWKEWKPVHDKLLAKLEKELGEDAITGEGSQDALREALLKNGVPLYRKTDTGILQTNKFALQEFEDDFPVVKRLMEWRTADRFLTTYIGPMRERDVVHPDFNQCGAWTGRMSCRRPNMQNVPKHAGKEVRSMFVPRPGYVFVVCDFDSIEVRLLAHYLGKAGAPYRQLIEDGHDPHAWMAAAIHGGGAEQYFKGTPGQPLRDAAKNTMFAITYGAGGPRVTDMNKLDPGPIVDGKPQFKAGKALCRTIKVSLPGYFKLNSRIKSKIESVGYVNTIYGRKNPVKPDKAYVGLNALIQGSAADIMKQAVVNTAEATSDLGAQMLLLVHDEIVNEVPIESAQECLRLQTEAMVAAAPEGFAPTLKVTGGVVETSYADA